MLKPRRGSSKRISRSKIDATDPNEVVALARVSTDHQQNSIENQQTVLSRFAESKGLNHKIFCDEGVSASTTKFLKRPAVRKMMAYIKKHNIKTILMVRPNRAFRDSLDYEVTINELQNQGIYFRFTEMDIDLSTPQGEMVFAFSVQVAKMETKTRQQSQLQIVEMYREQRISRNGKAPYGWITMDHATERTKSGKPMKVLVPDEEKQQHLKMIKSWRDDQLISMPKIADKLNAMGIPSPMAGKQVKRFIKDSSGVKTSQFKMLDCNPQWSTRGVITVYEHMDIATQEELELTG